MKKPVKEEPKKRGRKSLADKLMAEIEDAYQYAKNRFDQHELDYYIDKDFTIKGNVVDKDENITAEQVAILGGYSLMSQLRDRLNDIKEGKEPQDSTGAEIVAIDGNTGKKIKNYKMPKEIRDMLKKYLEETE